MRWLETERCRDYSSVQLQRSNIFDTSDVMLHLSYRLELCNGLISNWETSTGMQQNSRSHQQFTLRRTLNRNQHSKGRNMHQSYCRKLFFLSRIGFSMEKRTWRIERAIGPKKFHYNYSGFHWLSLCGINGYRGVKYIPLLRAPRAAGARNICVGFADVTRASGVNLAHMSRKCYAAHKATGIARNFVARHTCNTSCLQRAMSNKNETGLIGAISCARQAMRHWKHPHTGQLCCFQQICLQEKLPRVLRALDSRTMCVM
jgi:hypothetical protein